MFHIRQHRKHENFFCQKEDPNEKEKLKMQWDCNLWSITFFKIYIRFERNTRSSYFEQITFNSFFRTASLELRNTIFIQWYKILQKTILIRNLIELNIYSFKSVNKTYKQFSLKSIIHVNLLVSFPTQGTPGNSMLETYNYTPPLTSTKWQSMNSD